MGVSDPTATPTANGQTRWAATLPFADIQVAFVGSSEALSSTSLTTSTSSEYSAGSIIVLWARQFYPESLDFIVDALLRGAFVDELDAEAMLSDGTVLVSTVKDVDAPTGEERMSITISITG
jgi:hypothetical protein